MPSESADARASARAEATLLRDADATLRDRRADERDVAAEARDGLAVSVDDQAERDGSSRASGRCGRDRASDGRDRATDRRDDAARDRASAAQDRRDGAADRLAAADDLAMEGIDYLTGVLRRRMGLLAIQREMDRTARSGESLTVAFVDVDGLKAINDLRGHAAADDVLRAVARCIGEGLRPYDVIARYGGDEFICSIAGHDAGGVRERFAEISARLATTPHGPTVTVGLAERRPEELLDDLVHRADTAMFAARTA